MKIKVKHVHRYDVIRDDDGNVFAVDGVERSSVCPDVINIRPASVLDTQLPIVGYTEDTQVELLKREKSK